MADEDSGLGNGTTRPLTEGDYGANWIAAAQTGSRNTEPRPNLFNAVLALRHDPAWRDAFGFDEMLSTAVFLRSKRPIEDYHIFMVHHWMQQNGIETMGLEPVREAIELVARDYPFHPLRAHLNSLEWDGESRLANWLHRYIGTADDNYHASIGYWFLIAMVARVFKPGCKCDYMPVLEGPQGIEKSKVLAALAREYFSDQLPDIGSGDPVRISMHIRGKWLFEVAELDAFNRAETSRLKAFLTAQVEQYIPKHARKEVREPRQCVFAGTTNKDSYLRDETGNRRFWPVRTGRIELAALEADRDKLLAEAVAAFKEGKQWWPDHDFEASTIKPVQETRFEVDAWEHALDITDYGPDTALPLVEIARQALHLEKARLTVGDQRRIAACLRRLKWTQARVSGKGNLIWKRP